MDKNKLLGILFLGGAFWLMTQMPKPENRYRQSSQGAVSETGAVSSTAVTSHPNGGMTKNNEGVQAPTTFPAPTATQAKPEETFTLLVENQIEATFTTNGGGIKEIRFLNEEDRFRKYNPRILDQLKHDRVEEILGALNEAVSKGDQRVIRKLEKDAKKAKIPLAWIAKAKAENTPFEIRELLEADNNYVINEGQARPILDLDYTSKEPYEMTEQTGTSITFLRQQGDLVIKRYYELVEGTFQMRHYTSLQNLGGSKIDLGNQLLYGMGASLPTTSDIRHEFQNVGFYAGQRGWTSRRKPTIFKLPKMQKEGGRMMENSGGIHWATVRNQFFAVSLAPLKPTSGVVKGHVFDLGSLDHKGDPKYGVRGEFGLNVDPLEPGQTLKHEFILYTGPKEFKRLSKVGKNQDLVMQFGFFGIFSKLLLLLMQTLHGFLNNWGWSIILMTVIVKMLFWPLTKKAAESQKRMSKIQGPMKEIQAKYKEKPQKMQQEVSKLFRENKVNPVAGCLPILIQMPIFLGLFFMLRSAAELRFAEFFWVKDLSQPEHLFHWGFNIPILGEYFNLLPILMCITMFFQMRMTPIPPSADEMQQMQAKMFRFLPFIFVFMLYGFSAGLVLYWTVQNLLTIVQQTITNKKMDLDPIVLPSTAKKKARKQ
jgi:YidC/Oxa1 family membrane protein insertase